MSLCLFCIIIILIIISSSSNSSSSSLVIVCVFAYDDGVVPRGEGCAEPAMHVLCEASARPTRRLATPRMTCLEYGTP